MKKSLLFYLIVAMMALLALSAAAEETVYLNDGGNGTGISADSPLGSLEDAFDILAQSGGKVVITDTYTFNAPFYAPTHEKNITISGGQIVTNHPSFNRFYFAGPTTVENIKFTIGSENSSKTAMFVAGYHPLVIGKGVSVQSDLIIYVLGGYQLPATDKENKHATNRDSSIVVESGNWHAVVGFSRGSGTTNYTGTSNITVNGGTIKTVYGASISGSYSGSANITVNGGTVNALCTAGDATRRINGDAKVTINGGTVKSLNLNNVMGHTTVNFFGGTIDIVSRTVEDKIKEFVVDGKMDLVVRKGVHAQAIMDVFDTAKYEDGSEISGAIDADVASYTLLDTKPEKSTAHPAKIYVANVGDGTGFTPDSPISDLAQAYDMLSGIDGTIVLINTVEFKSNFIEPNHDNKIVITSFDGVNYFDGGIKFDKGRRFFFGGDTTFENTKIDFEGTLLFVGRFHNIAFGTGLVTPTIDVASIYVLGGYQLYESDTLVPHNVDNHITIESGNYYAVIGYTRGVEISGYIHDFTGTSTLNLLGGSVDRVYGGPIQSSEGDNVVINVDGCRVNKFIQVGGDQSIHSNNAVVNVKSGYVKQLDMRNVLDTVTVNWTGGDIDEFACNNCEYQGEINEELLALFENSTYVLNYMNVEPTDEMLKWFDTVTNDIPQGSTTVKLTIGSTTAYINGVAQTLDAAPINRLSRTMLPVRFLANAFGVDNGGIKWDAATRTATLTNSEVTIVVTIDAKEMLVNGKAVALDSPAIIESNRTYLPVRAIANALGVANDNIAWDAATNTATLVK
ncbi:MAG: copper amine oxidase N-terminal domain-containing protein [Ruminococcaceae bacterium]|nr:copper amine oxidase N-terminal domain-containing protein [Oscillospiraceae bacterium]